MMNNEVIPIMSMSKVFVVLFVLGILFTLPLYKFNIKKLITSKLFIKIVFWIPIFLVFIFVLYANTLVRCLIVLALLLLAIWDIVKIKLKTHKIFVAVYYVVFGIAGLHLILLSILFDVRSVGYLIIICFSSVLSDVTAYFMGNYLGKHKLPQSLNNNKSWEGVLGQLLGALLGVIVVNVFIFDVSNLWIFLPIGLGSIAGDLLNSYVKRKLQIKDWGNSIPGHGGYLDRLSSLFGSILFTTCWILLALN